MAKAVFFTKPRLRLRVDNSDYPIAKVDFEKQNTKVTENLNILRRILAKSYGVAKPINKPLNVKVEPVLPFRIKFVNIGIEGYGPNNVPPIGIAVVGYNNYIL